MGWPGRFKLSRLLLAGWSGSEVIDEDKLLSYEMPLPDVDVGDVLGLATSPSSFSSRSASDLADDPRTSL